MFMKMFLGEIIFCVPISVVTQNLKQVVWSFEGGNLKDEGAGLLFLIDQLLMK